MVTKQKKCDRKFHKYSHFCYVYKNCFIKIFHGKGKKLKNERDSRKVKT